VKKEIALQLADAITSGHYQRAGGYNRTSDNRFCIGGVLINLFAQVHPELAAKETDPLRFMGTNSTLPYQVMAWADIKHGNMGSRDGKHLAIVQGTTRLHPMSLQHANDARVAGHPASSRPFLYTWDEIATWLRSGKNHARI
jgi:hypothetical protein